MVKHLNTLGICHLAEWDVLVFVYRHGTSLANSEKICRLLGYSKAVVSVSLASLTSAGLLQRRSRDSRGVSLYQIADTVQNDSMRCAFEELMKVAEQRQGRLLLIRNLRQGAVGNRFRLWRWLAFSNR